LKAPRSIPICQTVASEEQARVQCLTPSRAKRGSILMDFLLRSHVGV
jgi:hypothetical protein